MVLTAFGHNLSFVSVHKCTSFSQDSKQIASSEASSISSFKKCDTHDYGKYKQWHVLFLFIIQQ